MKRFLSIVLILVLVLGMCSFTACDLLDDEKDSADTTTTTTTTTTTPPINPPDEDCEHDFTDWRVIKEASYTETGYKIRVCYLCEEVDGAVIPLLKEKITLWVSPTMGVQEFTEAKIEEFFAAHPEYSKYEVVIETVGEGDAATEVLWGVKSTPDMYCFAQDQLYRLVQNNALAPLGQQASQTVKNNNDSGSVKAASVGETLYAYPMTSDNGYYLYYDASVISDEEAKSVEGIIAACQRSGKTFGYNLSNAWIMASFFFAQPVDGGEPLCTSKWTFSADGKNAVAVNDTFNSANGLIAMKVMNALATSGVWIDNSDYFGGTAAIVTGIWNNNQAEAVYGKNMRAAKLPTFTVDGETYQLGSFSGYKLLGCKPQTDPERAELCQELALYLTSEEAQLERYYEFGWGPSNTNVQADEDVKNNMSLTALIEQNIYAQPQGTIPGDWWVTAAKLGVMASDSSSTEADLSAALNTYEEAIQNMIE